MPAPTDRRSPAAERWLLRTLLGSEIREDVLSTATGLSAYRLGPLLDRSITDGLVTFDLRDAESNGLTRPLAFYRLTSAGEDLARSFGPTSPDRTTGVLHRLRHRSGLRKR